MINQTNKFGKYADIIEKNLFDGRTFWGGKIKHAAPYIEFGLIIFCSLCAAYFIIRIMQSF